MGGRPIVWAASFALAAALLSGCGDESSTGREDAEAQIEATTARFQQILAAKDVQAFCEILAPNDVLKLGGGRTKGEKECLSVWGRERNPLFRAQDPKLEIEALSFEGAYATAELANGGELAFAREGGRWYVHLQPGPGQMKGEGS
ncbi:MAG TPA: hypothetical protein VHF50_01920 [Solirubrobacterales bacterium]|nr:hypothetical protein [Solirubrobacterales bacterium]